MTEYIFKYLNMSSPDLLGKKCVFPLIQPTLSFGPTLNFFMAVLVENYLNVLFLPSNVVFYV